MAELADAHGSGPCGSNTMRVQVPFSALYRASDENQELFLRDLSVKKKEEFCNFCRIIKNRSI